MPVFEYSAVTPEGQTERGTLVGSSLDDAAQRLAGRGLTVNQLGVAQDPNDPVTEIPREQPRQRSALESKVVGAVVGSVALQDLQFFFKQLGTMLSAGIGPGQALGTLSSQSKSSKMRRIVEEMRDATNSGQMISSVMHRYPEVFTGVMTSMIEVGESSGVLSDQCQLISHYIRKEIEIRNIIRRETFMPKATIVTSILIILGANAVIASFGAAGAQTLWSPLTQIETWFFLGPLLLLIFLFFRVGLKFSHIKLWWDRFLMTMPGFKGVYYGFAMAKFSQILSVLYRAGVPLPHAVQLAANASGNDEVARRIAPASHMIANGESLTPALAKTGGVSPIVLDMTDTGEKTGNVDSMLEKAAEYYEDESTTKAKQLANVIGILAILAVGAYVAMVVISFYTGYFGNIGSMM